MANLRHHPSHHHNESFSHLVLADYTHIYSLYIYNYIYVYDYCHYWTKPKLYRGKKEEETNQAFSFRGGNCLKRIWLFRGPMSRIKEH